jgi:arsenite methyltransferase
MTSVPSLFRLWSLLPGDAWRPGGLKLTERAMDLGAFPAGARLLDLGCGRGTTARYIRNRYGIEAWGLDISREALTVPSNGFLIQGDGENLPLTSQILDGIFLECVLSLLTGPEKALREGWRVLRRGGQLLITDLYLKNPADRFPGNFPRGSSCLCGALGEEAWTAMAEAAGFEALVWEDHSELLVESTARLVWELGSRKALLEHLLPDPCTAGQGMDLSKMRPGYFLMLARKKEKK